MCPWHSHEVFSNLCSPASFSLSWAWWGCKLFGFCLMGETSLKQGRVVEGSVSWVDCCEASPGSFWMWGPLGSSSL